MSIKSEIDNLRGILNELANDIESQDLDSRIKLQEISEEMDKLIIKYLNCEACR